MLPSRHMHPKANRAVHCHAHPELTSGDVLSSRPGNLALSLPGALYLTDSIRFSSPVSGFETQVTVVEYLIFPV